MKTILGHCHCESCRRIQGAAFVTWTSVPITQFKIINGRELVHKYESSKEIIWMRCCHCGSSLFQSTKHSPHKIYINIASLQDKLDREPSEHVSIEEKVDWIKINDGLPQVKEKASEVF